MRTTVYAIEILQECVAQGYTNYEVRDLISKLQSFYEADILNQSFSRNKVNTKPPIE